MSSRNLLEIAVAWMRAMRPSPDQQRRAEARLLVCNSCEHKYWRGSYEEYTCAACGCPLQKKVYSPRGKDACPLQKWDA